MISEVRGRGSLLEVMSRDEGCVPRGAVVGREFGSSGVRCRCRIGLVRRSGGNGVILFQIPARTKGAEYFVGGGALY